MEVELNGKNITIGVLALLVTALAGFGGNEVLDKEQFDNAYVCDLNEELGVFLGGISGSQYTGYPHTEDRTEPARCKVVADDLTVKGKWIDLEKYANDHGVDPLSLFVQGMQEYPVLPEPSENKWIPAHCCSPDGCKPGGCPSE